MTRPLRTTLLIALFAFALLPGSAAAATPPPPGEIGGGTGSIFPPPTSAAIPLVPDEVTHSFRVPKSPVTVRPGVIRIIAIVPASAKGSHGVGLDGGEYKNIKGAVVSPGRISSLTVQLSRGKYTMFDSKEGNRALGYRMRLNVSAKAPKIKRRGKRCKSFASFGEILYDTRVTRASCKLAARIGESAFEYWEDADFRVSSVATRGYRCKIITRSPIGLRVACRQGSKHIRFTV